VEIFNNKFDGAIAFLPDNVDKVNQYNKKEKAIFRYLNVLKPNFDRELKLREKDKTADLPRVEMKIKGKGTVVRSTITLPTASLLIAVPSCR